MKRPLRSRLAAAIDAFRTPAPAPVAVLEDDERLEREVFRQVSE